MVALHGNSRFVLHEYSSYFWFLKLSARQHLLKKLGSAPPNFAQILVFSFFLLSTGAGGIFCTSSEEAWVWCVQSSGRRRSCPPYRD